MLSPKKQAISQFAQQVYAVTAQIPSGQVSTYQAIAKAINRPKAARAVGNALNQNPYWPEVPCHRVVGSNGHLTGFANGLKDKQKLLEKEGIIINNNRVINFKKFFYELPNR